MKNRDSELISRLNNRKKKNDLIDEKRDTCYGECYDCGCDCEFNETVKNENKTVKNIPINFISRKDNEIFNQEVLNRYKIDKNLAFYDKIKVKNENKDDVLKEILSLLKEINENLSFIKYLREINEKLSYIKYFK